MSQELPAVKTQVAPVEMFEAMVQAWYEVFNAAPKKESILLLMSHWALETGAGKSMWCYNLGNVKAKPGGSYDYCFFKCNEILTNASANAYAAKDPEHAKITSRRADGKTSIIWFYPPHPGCCFRAFRTLEDGAADHLVLLNKRFSKSWPAVLLGDPVFFCHTLKQQRYYTADEGVYTRAVRNIFNSYVKVMALGMIGPRKEPAPPPTPEPVAEPLVLPSATFNKESALHTPTEEEEVRIYSPFSMKDEE